MTWPGGLGVKEPDDTAGWSGCHINRRSCCSWVRVLLSAVSRRVVSGLRCVGATYSVNSRKVWPARLPPGTHHHQQECQVLVALTVSLGLGDGWWSGVVWACVGEWTWACGRLWAWICGLWEGCRRGAEGRVVGVGVGGL